MLQKIQTTQSCKMAEAQMSPQLKYVIYVSTIVSEEENKLIYMIHLDNFQHVVLNYNLQNF